MIVAFLHALMLGFGVLGLITVAAVLIYSFNLGNLSEAFRLWLLLMIAGLIIAVIGFFPYYCFS